MSIFSKISLKKPKRTVHNLSYSSKLSLGFGQLVPIMCEKVMPGDKFVHSHEFLMRFAPMAGQLFQSFHTRVDYFFVPSRLLWKNFERFLVDENNDFPHPYFAGSDLWDGENIPFNTLIDYFNLPTNNYNSDGTPAAIDGSAVNVAVDALPFAAYLKIISDYYLDENLPLYTFDEEDNLLEVPFESFIERLEAIFDNNQLNGSSYANLLMETLKVLNTSPSDTVSDITDLTAFQPFSKAYPKDYFTSALPWAQRGPIVQIPLNGEGDIQVMGWSGTNRDIYQGVGVKASQTSPGASNQNVEVTLFQYGSNKGVSADNLGVYDDLGSLSGFRLGVMGEGNSVSSQDAAKDVISETNLARKITFKAVNVNGTATITDLRTAATVQAWLEKNARAGVRYKEQLFSHFGVKSRDYRLDRAELLNSSKANVSIGEIFTASAGNNQIPGLGVSTATGATAVKPWKHYFEEHGYVIGLMSIYPTAAYSQGVPRQFLELDKFDYPWPEFQNIGEQEIFNAELMLDDENGGNMNTFGYTPRYAQYKARTNQLHGDFRGTMHFMTASREFFSKPLLNRDFISIKPEFNNLYRIFNAVAPYNPSNSQPCYVDFFHNFKAIRPLQYFGNPRII